MRDAGRFVMRGAGRFVMRGAGRGLLVGVVVLAGLLGSACGAAAQDAGQTRGGRFVFVHGPAEARLAASLLRDAEGRDSFPGLPRLSDTVTVYLSADAGEFRRLVGDGAPDWGGAFAFPAQRRIVMQGRDARGGAGDPLVTLRHELAHLAVHEVLGPDVPRWFDEGYASFAAGEWGRDEVLATSFGLVWRGIPTLRGLDSLFYAGADRANRAYALSHRAVAELSALGGERGLSLLVNHWRREGSFELAVREAYGMTSADFERAWKSRVRRQYGAIALLADLSVLSVILVFLLGPLWWRQRKRRLERLARMRAMDAEQEARERASALTALLGEGPGGAPGGVAAPLPEGGPSPTGAQD